MPSSARTAAEWEQLLAARERDNADLRHERDDFEQVVALVAASASTEDREIVRLEQCGFA